MSENLISVNNVSVNFDYQENFISKKQKIHAVNNINIKIKKGSFFGLVGESGSGKTTLGRICNTEWQKQKHGYFKGSTLYKARNL